MYRDGSNAQNVWFAAGLEGKLGRVIEFASFPDSQEIAIRILPTRLLGEFFGEPDVDPIVGYGGQETTIIGIDSVFASAHAVRLEALGARWETVAAEEIFPQHEVKYVCIQTYFNSWDRTKWTDKNARAVIPRHIFSRD